MKYLKPTVQQVTKNGASALAKLIISALLIITVNATVKAQPTAVGDIVFTGYQASGPTTNTDQFAFVPLVNLPAGTVIKFTDNAWNSSTLTFNPTESNITFTVTPSAIAAGTEIRIIVGPPAQALNFAGSSVGTVGITGTPSLPTPGDQIFAYKGTDPDNVPSVFFSGIHMNVETGVTGCPGPTTAAGWDPASCVFPTAPSNNTSMKPAALTTDVNAFWSPVEHDNGKFNGCGLNLSTPAAVRAAVNNPANWIFDDAGANLPPWGLTMSGCAFLVPSCSIGLSSAPATTSQTVCINTPITNITYATTLATGATFSGLPSGVTGSWAANVVTISGSPSTTVGSPFNYTVTLTGGGCSNTATGSITVLPNKTITLTSAPATTSQTVTAFTPITNITYSTTNATGATFSGLPAGVTGNWAANVVTISGSPTTTVGSPFNYTITPTGTCGSATANGTITVNPAVCSITLTSAPATTSQTVLVNSAITNITYSTVAATGATFSGLPAGVTGSWAANVVTISGTPTVIGTFNYSVTLTGGSCTTENAGGSITVNGIPATLATGDIVFTGYQASGPTTNTDQFAFVPLVNLPPATVIKFTDNAWNSSTLTFDPTESNITFTVTGAAIAAGTEIRIIVGPPAQALNFAGSSVGTVGVTGTPSLPTPGDQIIAYQGPDLAPTTFISGIHMNVETGATGCPGPTTAAGWDPASCVFPTAPSNNTSMKPAALTTDVNAFWSPVEHDNGKFNGCGLNLSTPAAVRAAVNNPVNWIFDDAGANLPPWGLTMSGCTFLVSSCSIGLSSAPATTSQTVCINTPITNITYATTIATGATFSGLPAGVTGNWAANVVTISGSPTTTVGSPFNYTVTLTGGGCSNTATGSITVLPNKTITLTSAPGTNAQTVTAFTPITNITYSTTNATGATFSGLPAGVTGSWAANVVTISGSPTTTVGSPFNYTVTPTGVCGSAIANGTITVNPAVCSITLTSAPGTIAQTVNVNSAITNITYSTTGATGAGFSGLPAGVTGSWAANVITISGTPTVAGTFNYTVTLTGGLCTTENTGGSITVNGPPATLAAGDIAFSGYISDDVVADQFSFVLLKTIGPGTVIKFTDYGWRPTENQLKNNGILESEITFTATSNLSAGQEITIVGTTVTVSGGPGSGTAVYSVGASFLVGNLSLASNGDQLFAYQGNFPTPTTFIAGIHMNVYTGAPSTTTAAAWDGDLSAANQDNNNSGKPAALTTGINANWFSTEWSNARFICASTPINTIAEVRAALNSGNTAPGNWLVNNNNPSGLTLPTLCSYVGCPTITVNNPGVTTGTNGTAFSQTFTQSGGALPVTFSLNSGLLPNGLTLSAAGVLSGTPSAPAATYAVTIKVTDANNCTGIGATYNLVISCQTITVTNPAVTTGTQNTAFSQTFIQSGGIGAIVFSTVSALPTGLTLSGAGLLSGTPTVSGTFPIVVKATDINGCFGNGATYNLVISNNALETWELSAAAGSQATSSPSFTAPNIGTGVLQRGAGVTASAAGGSMSSSGWYNSAAATTLAQAIANNEYYEFTLPVNAGFVANLSSVSMYLRSSATGPATATLRSSAEGFTADLGTASAIPNAASTLYNIPLTLNNVTGTLTFRLYGYGPASGGGTPGTGGTMRIGTSPTAADNDLVISGNLVAVAPAMTASLRDALLVDVNSNGQANPGDQLRYTNTIRNTGTDDGTGVNFNDSVPVNTVLNPGSKVTSALARDDNFTTTLNTVLNTGNLLTNDFGLPAVSVVSFGTTASNGTTTLAGSTGTTNAGGTLTVNADGTFSYTPPLNFSGIDKFKYIATTAVAGLPNNDAVVTIFVQ